MTPEERLMLQTYRKTKVKKDNRFGKQMVALIIALNVFYAIGVLLVYYHTGGEPSVLTGCWFGFTTGELWMMASIKKNKIEKDDKNENKLDSETFK